MVKPGVCDCNDCGSNEVGAPLTGVVTFGGRESDGLLLACEVGGSEPGRPAAESGLPGVGVPAVGLLAYAAAAAAAAIAAGPYIVKGKPADAASR